MPAGFRLGDVPAWRLLDSMAFPGAGTRVAGASSAALVIRDGVLEVGIPGMTGAGRERAAAVADLDKVTEGVVRLIGMRLARVVARVCCHLFERHGHRAATGESECPRGSRRSCPVIMSAARSERPLGLRVGRPTVMLDRSSAGDESG